MNDLFSTSSFKKYADASPQGAGGGDMEAGGESVANLDMFFEEVEAVKEDMRGFETLYKRLQSTNEETKTAHEARAIKSLRSRMDGDVEQVLKRAKAVKAKLEALDKDNANSRKAPGCGPGSSTDRTRTSVVAGLRKKLRDSMESFSALRARVSSEYRDTVARRYFTVTGAQPDEATLDTLAETGEGERFLQRAIAEQGQGRGEVMGVVAEIQERHGAVADLERSLLELHQVFNDMAVLVAAQGEQLDDIEGHVGRARSFVDRGREQLQVARKHQKSSRKWKFIAIGILLVIILVIVIPIVLKNTKNSSSSNNSNQPQQ